jgi:signal transduction histidine kinase
MVYGILGGLIVPKLPILPANVINVETFTQVFLLPPAVFRSFAGLVLVVAIVRALEVFDLETQQLISQMEEHQIISMERERMARDLHDGALQQVYAAGLLAQSLQKQAPETLSSGLGRLVLTINHSIEQLRSFLIKGEAEIENIELIPALEHVLDEARRVLPIETHWETPHPPTLAPEQINHLVAFTREVISNAIRHSQTERVEVHLKCVDEHLRCIVRDFGQGLPENPEAGYGLRNMRDRARLLGADLHFESESGKGTTVILDMPVEERS